MKQGELIAGAIALAVAAPLVYMFASAVVDGQERSTEAPFRALLGNDTYDALAAAPATSCRDDADCDSNLVCVDRQCVPSMSYMGDDRTAPNFTLRDRAGRSWSLDDHRGQVVVMNFWTITCQPCLEEMPSIMELDRLLADRDDVELVTVSTDSGWPEVANVFPRGSTLPVLFDPDREIVNGRFGTRLFPETWFIDPRGVIRLRIDGPRDWARPIVIDLIDSLF